MIVEMTLVEGLIEKYVSPLPAVEYMANRRVRAFRLPLFCL